MWILDQLAALGGFLVFAFLFFRFPCAAIQNELYYAKIMHDSYRMKFNKIIKGVKDEPYKPKPKKAQPKKKIKKSKTIEMKDVNPDQLEESMNSEERKE